MIDTPHGPARAHLHAPRDGEPRAALMLGHGAGGGIAARDLQAVTAAARELGFAVALVEQPYVVAGRRSPAPAHQLDAAWLAVVEHLRAGELAGLPLVTGGRSSGARVACRTAAAAGAAGVLCLAFPVHPPGSRRRAGSTSSTASRSPCSSSRARPTRSACRPRAPGREVVVVPGTHSFTRPLTGVVEAARRWLADRR